MDSSNTYIQCIKITNLKASLCYLTEEEFIHLFIKYNNLSVGVICGQYLYRIASVHGDNGRNLCHINGQIMRRKNIKGVCDEIGFRGRFTDYDRTEGYKIDVAYVMKCTHMDNSPVDITLDDVIGLILRKNRSDELKELIDRTYI